MTSRQESATISIIYSSSIETIQRLKSMSNISTINFVQDSVFCGEDHTKVVDNLVDLLNTNHNIKSLNCRVSINSTKSLFQALAAGKAGYNLQSLQQHVYLGEAAATELGSYLTTNRNMKSLAANFYGPAAVQLVSCLACSTVVEFELNVFDKRGCLRNLGSKLGQCNLIVSLRICFVYTDSQLDSIKSFFKEGLANMRCLKHLAIQCKFRCSSPETLAFRDGFLETIKSSSSIMKAELKQDAEVSESFHDEVDSFCILNKVFGTNLIGFDPTELWTRVLVKVRNDSARATFLFRLLREKPELLIVGNVQTTCLQKFQAPG